MLFPTRAAFSSFPIRGVLIVLLSYHLGRFAGREDLSWGLFEVGALAWVLAEIGSWLAEDYYRYREGRGEGKMSSPAMPTLSQQMTPPQLVLKGAWGVYLVAFFFSLIVTIALAERGWRLILIAFFGFLTGYYRYAPPLFWNKRQGGKIVSLLGQIALPYLSALVVGKAL